MNIEFSCRVDDQCIALDREQLDLMSMTGADHIVLTFCWTGSKRLCFLPNSQHISLILLFKGTEFTLYFKYNGFTLCDSEKRVLATH